MLIDEDDYAENCGAYGAIPPIFGWHIRTTKGITQGDKIREVWDEVKDCAWLGLIGGDNIPETPGWDRLLVAELQRCCGGEPQPRRLPQLRHHLSRTKLQRLVRRSDSRGEQHLTCLIHFAVVGRR